MFEDNGNTTIESNPDLFEARMEFSKKWNWYEVLQTLSNDNILDNGKILALQVQEVFTYLTYQKHKNSITQKYDKRN